MRKNKMPETIIKREIVRKIKTGDFEQLDIIVGFQEKISWNNLEDKNKKIKELDKSLINDFVDVYNEATKTIGVERHIGEAKLDNQNYNKETDEKFKKKQSAIDVYKEKSTEPESKKEIVEAKNMNDNSITDLDDLDFSLMS